MQVGPVGAELLYVDRQTDRQMTKLVSLLEILRKAPKMQ